MWHWQGMNMTSGLGLPAPKSTSVAEAVDSWAYLWFYLLGSWMFSESILLLLSLSSCGTNMGARLLVHRSKRNMFSRLLLLKGGYIVGNKGICYRGIIYGLYSLTPLPCCHSNYMSTATTAFWESPAISTRPSYACLNCHPWKPGASHQQIRQKGRTT